MPSNRDRAMRTQNIDGLIAAERGRIFAQATPEQRERLRAAEKSREVYRAWNAVCAGTREGNHVTGLRYLPDSNELLVYLDDAVWTQELTMLREIIRGRMEREGVSIDGFLFRTSKRGYGASSKRVLRPELPTNKPAVPHAELSDDEERNVNERVAAIEDARLREAMKKAMKASLEWKKGSDALKKP